MMDLKFCDMLGTWQHCSYPIETVDESIFTDGLDFENHAFLTWGGVFSDDLLASWIRWKREEELDPIALRPHPCEFHLYYDC